MILRVVPTDIHRDQRGHLTFTDQGAPIEGVTLMVNQDVVKVEGIIVMRRVEVPVHQGSGTPHHWADTDGNPWTGFRIEALDTATPKETI